MDEQSGGSAGEQVDLAVLAQRAGITFSDEELAHLVPKVAQLRTEVETLRAVIQLEEEPAHAFAKQVRGARP